MSWALSLEGRTVDQYQNQSSSLSFQKQELMVGVELTLEETNKTITEGPKDK